MFYTRLKGYTDTALKRLWNTLQNTEKFNSNKADNAQGRRSGTVEGLLQRDETKFYPRRTKS